jgi:DNA-binding transcriptional LysR family regulator
VNAVAAGLGFSLLPEYVQELLPRTVVARPLDLNPAPEVELFVAYRKDDRLPALAFFLSLLREHKPAARGHARQAASKRS